MTNPSPALEPSFLASQRARLLALHIDLLRTGDRYAEEAHQVLAAGLGHANEAEDRAQDLNLADNDRYLSSQLAGQRVAIERALAKLEDGTYGLSDASGLPIPIARLRAFPQAVLTIAEESKLS